VTLREKRPAASSISRSSKITIRYNSDFGSNVLQTNRIPSGMLSGLIVPFNASTRGISS